MCGARRLGSACVPCDGVTKPNKSKEKKLSNFKNKNECWPRSTLLRNKIKTNRVVEIERGKRKSKKKRERKRKS